jgi:hypothetical protein
MLQVISKNVNAVLPEANHHEVEIGPFRDALIKGLLASKLAKDDLVHRVRQGRSGPNSWSLRISTGAVYRFRMYGPYTALEVKNQNKNFFFLTPAQAYKWAAALSA